MKMQCVSAILITLSAVLALVESQATVRNAYAEALYRGATTFLKYIDQAGLDTLLKDPKENLTVLAPSEVAFHNLSPDVLERAESDPAFLKELMSFHVVQGQVNVRQDDLVFTTLSGDLARVDVYANPDMTTLSGSPILLADNPATNGVVHILDTVMYPIPSGTAVSFVGDNTFSMLFLALSKAGVTPEIRADDITLFAPTNAAFQKLPPGLFSQLMEDVPLLTKVLQNHIVSGVVYSAYVQKKGGDILTARTGQSLNVTVNESGAVMRVEGAEVTSRDVNVDNGVVQVIDAVLLPDDVRRALSSPSFRVV